MWFICLVVSHCYQDSGNTFPRTPHPRQKGNLQWIFESEKYVKQLREGMVKLTLCIMVSVPQLWKFMEEVSSCLNDIFFYNILHGRDVYDTVISFMWFKSLINWLKCSYPLAQGILIFIILSNCNVCLRNCS